MARPPASTSRNIPAKPVSGSGGFFIPQYQMNSIIEGIIQILRKNFEEMIKDLKHGQTRTPPTSIFSKIKNFLWGYENKKNPWYMANRLGGLGYQSPMRKEATLHEYQMFSKWINQYNNIQNKINEERLVLDDMIAPFLAKLEDDIRDYLRSAVQPFYLYQPSFKGEPEQSGTKKGPEAAVKGKSEPAGVPSVSGALDISSPADVSGDVSSATTDGGDSGLVSKPVPKKSGKVKSPSATKGPVKSSSPSSAAAAGTSDSEDASRLGDVEALVNPPKQAGGPGPKRIASWLSSINDMGDIQEESMFYQKTTDQKIIKEFEDCTLYEKTLVCLEHLRSMK